MVLIRGDNARVGDLFVHVRLRRCCRETLVKLDRALSHLDGIASTAVFETVGSMPVDRALAHVDGLEIAMTGPAAARVREVFTKLCDEHAAVHEGEGAHTEASLWRALRTAVVDASQTGAATRATEAAP
jgi:hypothetical protein